MRHACEPDFLRCVFAGATRSGKTPFERVLVRAVELRDGRRVQISRFDGKKDFSTNHTAEELPAALADVLAAGFANVHITTTTEDIDLRLTKKGQVLIGRKKAAATSAATTHNREKALPLPEGREDRLLSAMGVLDRHHRVRPTMRDKFTQINEFLKLRTHVLPEILEHRRDADATLTILDCGCGASYLTLATAHYLQHILKIPARVVGVDVNEEVIAKSRARVQELACENIDFCQGKIGELANVKADIVLVLHACDTATDDALAHAVKSEAKLIMAVPCCHKELHDRLHVPALAAIDQHGILHQRQADLVTDTFRALLLKVMGYRAEVIEFISPEHTARNLMIRAVRTRAAGDLRAIAEYRAFREFTRVVPYLEKALGGELTGILQ